MDALIGHMSYAALFRREALTCFRACYDFARAGFITARPLWKSVRKELEIFRGIVVLLFRCLDQPWSDSVVCTDACESGHAAVEGMWDVNDVESIGRWQERWRYKSERHCPAKWRKKTRAC